MDKQKNFKSKVLIFGLGYSGQRFANLIKKNHQVYFYAHRKNLQIPKYACSLNSLDELSSFRAAIISSPTSTHLKYLKFCIKAKIPTLIDKPFTDSLKGVNQLVLQAREQNQLLMVGFNLRFLPVIKKINDLLDQKALGEIYHAQFYVGQYLPSWHPDKDYSKTYSANFSQGGGVALDLIHELDLAYYFFPEINLRPVFSEKVSRLKIDVEDLAIFQTKTKPFVQVKLDYLNRQLTRRYSIVGEKGSVDCDIINHEFAFTPQKGKTIKLTAKKYFDTKKTYADELNHFFKLIENKTCSKLSERSLALDALQVAIKARKHVQKS